MAMWLWRLVRPLARRLKQNPPGSNDRIVRVRLPPVAASRAPRLRGAMHHFARWDITQTLLNRPISVDAIHARRDADDVRVLWVRRTAHAA
jgi:hypothetical protein